MGNSESICKKMFEQMMIFDESGDPKVDIYNYTRKDVVVDGKLTVHFIPEYLCSCSFTGDKHSMYSHLVEKHKLPVALILNFLGIQIPSEFRTPEPGAVKS